MKFKKKIFPNGMRSIVVPMPQSLTATVLVLTETGSKYETKRINGISHFLEHMCFKGTVRRPSAKAISGELDGLGARYNAFTSHEYTGYFAKAEARALGQMVDVVSDIYLNSVFPAEEMEKERGVIIGEIEMYEDDPRRHIWDVFTDLLYGDQPAGWNIAGTRTSVRKITRRDINAYKEKHYVAPATTVVIAGNVGAKEGWQMVARAFSAAPAAKKFGKRKIKELQKSPRLSVQYKKTKQTHLALGFRSHKAGHPKGPAIKVLTALLGAGMSSRLFHRIREEMGAGYYVGADNDTFSDHGFFAAFAGASSTRVPEVTAAILEELSRMRAERVGKSELAKVKNYLIGNMFSGLETSDAIASFYGAREIMGLPLLTPARRATEIRAVSTDDVREAARDVFRDKNLNAVFIGPVKKTDKLKKLLRLPQ